MIARHMRDPTVGCRLGTGCYDRAQGRTADLPEWRSLQVTYRKGRTFAAYLHLSHKTGEKSTKTVASTDGLLVVDYGSTGRSVGVEITAPRAVRLEQLNQLLTDLGETPLAEQEYEPVRAA